MKDFGYDVSDYKSIDPIFGTLDDFKSLVAKMNSLGLKLVMDFVPNHSSDQHEWFQKSIKKEDPYTDYYMWADPKIDENGTKQPPNNWVSVRGGSAWEYVEERGQYYLHQYLLSQPDLNLTNPVVIKELLEALDFWMDMGVSGFRIDAVTRMFEADGLPDEPHRKNSNDPNSYGYLKHIYTLDDPRIYGTIEKFRAQVDAYARKTDNVTRVLMTEAYTSIKNTMKYFGSESNPGSHIPFNFLLLYVHDRRATKFFNAVSWWMNSLPKGCWPNWLFGNHDNHRVATRFAPELVDALNMIIMLLPGIGITYYGEEIGMVDTHISWEDTKDPNGCHAGADRYGAASRDPERTPMQWSNASFAGFTNGNLTWLPVNENYVTLNVAEQKKSTRSHLFVYKQLLSLRESVTFQKGDLSVRYIGEQLFAFRRLYPGEDGLMIVINLGEEDLKGVNLQFAFEGLPEVASVNLTSIFSTVKPGHEVETRNLDLLANEGLVLNLNSTA